MKQKALLLVAVLILTIIGGAIIIVLPQIAKGKKHAVIVKCLSDWTMAGKPRGDALKTWYDEKGLKEKSVEIQECTNSDGQPGIVVWIGLAFGRRMGLDEDHKVQFDTKKRY